MFFIAVLGESSPTVTAGPNLGDLPVHPELGVRQRPHRLRGPVGDRHELHQLGRGPDAPALDALGHELNGVPAGRHHPQRHVQPGDAHLERRAGSGEHVERHPEERQGLGHVAGRSNGGSAGQQSQHLSLVLPQAPQQVGWDRAGGTNPKAVALGHKLDTPVAQLDE